MKFFIPSFVAGILSAVFLFQSQGAVEINAVYAHAVEQLKTAADVAITRGKFTSKNVTYKIGNKILSFSPHGQLINAIEKTGPLASVSGNGFYYVSYEKVGKEINFYNIKKERFWKKESREYPYLSYNAKLIFLMNGDHSKIRIVNDNGAETGVKFIEGRFCTIIAFSQKNDFGAIGFADGTYYFLNKKGWVINKGRTPAGTIIKGIAISSQGRFGALHYGDTKKDALAVVDLKKNNINTYAIKEHHIMKAALYTSDKGEVLFGCINEIICLNKNAGEISVIKIPARKPGFISFAQHKTFFSAGFMTAKGPAMYMIFTTEGEVILSKKSAEDSFISTSGNGSIIHLRGSHNLYGYNLDF